MQSSGHTVDSGAVQKGADFVKAFALGFDVNVSLSDAVQTMVQLIIRTRSLCCDWTTCTSTHSRSRT